MTDPLVNYFTDGALDGFIVFQSVLILIVLSNWLLLRRARRHPFPQRQPRVSILVPARNEEGRIGACLRSLLDQDYPDYEVIVLDDQSTDGTMVEILQVKNEFPRLVVVKGKPLPEGWLGKNWACHQLAESADGRILFYTDADTLHEPGSLSSIIRIVEGEKADLLTGVPRQVMRNWSERLLVPLFPWAFYSFNPLPLAYAIRFPELSAAVGQLMVFRREAYEKIGGHSRVKESMVEDLDLARAIKAAGLRWRVMDVTGLISCRMYHNGGEVFQGLAKNLFPAFEYRVLLYLFVWLWLGFVFLEPLAVLLAGALGAPLAADAWIKAWVCVALACFQWIFVFSRLKLPAWPGFFYPVFITGFLAMAFSSFWLTVTGRTSWKGRSIYPPRLRL